MDSIDDAERVLATTVEAAEEVLGERLVAVFALGSLAHGGFAPLVSDIDVALIVRGPDQSTGQHIAQINTLVLERSPGELARRLSLFWTDWDGVRHGPGRHDRLPAVDRLDLISSGRLLYGEDHRGGATPPEPDALIRDGAEFAAARFDPAYLAGLRRPAELVAAGARAASKAVLFPVRLLYTLHTGQIGLNDAAAGWYAEHGAHRPLSAEATRWRADGITDPEGATTLLRTHLAGLYRELFTEYRHALAATHPALATKLADAADQLR
ncbi:MAG TPA: hypothetical protein VGH89_26755 [Pseudonocardia sp.]|jgi:predicted nucleotidyltransferase